MTAVSRRVKWSSEADKSKIGLLCDDMDEFEDAVAQLTQKLGRQTAAMFTLAITILGSAVGVALTVVLTRGGR